MGGLKPEVLYEHPTLAQSAQFYGLRREGARRNRVTAHPHTPHNPIPKPLHGFGDARECLMRRWL